MSNGYTDHQRAAFKTRLAMAVKESGLSHGEITAKFGRSRGMIHHYLDPEKELPPPAVVFILERTLGLNPGELSQLLGYMPPNSETPPCTVEQAIANDPALHPKKKEDLYTIYRGFID